MIKWICFIAVITIIEPPKIKCTRDQLLLAQDYILLCNRTDYDLNTCFDSAMKIYCGKGEPK